MTFATRDIIAGVQGGSQTSSTFASFTPSTALILPSTSPVYKKYLDKFEKQEVEIEEMQATIKKLQDEEHRQREGYENYLGALDVE